MSSGLAFMGGGSVDDLVTETAVTDNYTLTAGDAGNAVAMNAATTKTITVPPNTSVPFQVGTVIELCRLGAGAVAIAAGAGVTLRSPSGLLNISAQYASASLRKRATDEWVLAGSLA